MTEAFEKKTARLLRERLLAEFVDRSTEMALFGQVLDSIEWPIMVVSAEAGMGKSSLLMRMVHECAVRGVLKVELDWSGSAVLDEMSVLRKLRDNLSANYFSAFTDLINYYTDDSYTPRLDINVNLRGGNIEVAGGAQIGGSSVRDIAGLVLHDNMIVFQRPDIPVPFELRREQLTERFLSGLKALSAERQVVLFFNAIEKMSDATRQWLWEQLLRSIVDDELNVRTIMLGQCEPPPNRYLAPFVKHTRLKPLGVDDIDDYIGKRVLGIVKVSDEQRRGMAWMAAVSTGGHPMEVRRKVEEFLVMFSTML